MRALLIALIVAVQLLLGWCYWNDAKDCCGDTAKTSKVTEISKKAAPAAAAVATTAAAVVKKVSEPLLFNWSDGKAITDDTWPNRKKSILDGLNKDQKLEITGLYRSDEKNNSQFENLGIARANETRKLFSELSDDRVILLGKLVNDKVDQKDLFASASFANRTVNKSIKETANGTQIYFPFNSTNKLNDSTVEKYLDDVATRVKSSGERVRLTGHTDALGSDASNMTLGQWRADVVQNYLMKRGVPASKIIAQSKGESQPIATNSTEAGRAKNRRTELQIIK